MADVTSCSTIVTGTGKVDRLTSSMAKAENPSSAASSRPRASSGTLPERNERSPPSAARRDLALDHGEVHERANGQPIALETHDHVGDSLG